MGILGWEIRDKKQEVGIPKWVTGLRSGGRRQETRKKMREHGMKEKTMQAKGLRHETGNTRKESHVVNTRDKKPSERSPNE